jgi:hypothetical protein
MILLCGSIVLISEIVSTKHHGVLNCILRNVNVLKHGVLWVKWNLSYQFSYWFYFAIPEYIAVSFIAFEYIIFYFYSVF